MKHLPRLAIKSVIIGYVVGFFLLTGYLSDWNPTFGYGAGVMLIIMLLNSQ